MDLHTISICHNRRTHTFKVGTILYFIGHKC